MKYIRIAIFTAIFTSLFTWGLNVASADGGFLNVTVNVHNANGGTLKAEEVSYAVNYNNNSTSELYLSDILTGNVQAFGFPKHVILTNSDEITYQVVPIVPAGYVAKLSETAHYGCGDTLTSIQMKLVNCTIYLSDDNYVAPPAASAPQTSGNTAYVSDNVAEMPQNTAYEAQQEELKALLMQIIDLLTQLIAQKMAQQI